MNNKFPILNCQVQWPQLLPEASNALPPAVALLWSVHFAVAGQQLRAVAFQDTDMQWCIFFIFNMIWRSEYIMIIFSQVSMFDEFLVGKPSTSSPIGHPWPPLIHRETPEKSTWNSWKTLLARSCKVEIAVSCVCVCNIWTDVKLLLF